MRIILSPLDLIGQNQNRDTTAITRRIQHIQKNSITSTENGLDFRKGARNFVSAKHHNCKNGIKLSSASKHKETTLSIRSLSMDSRLQQFNNFVNNVKQVENMKYTGLQSTTILTTQRTTFGITAKKATTGAIMQVQTPMEHW